MLIICLSMRWLLNNVMELNNEDNYYSWKDTFTEILFVVVASRSLSEEIYLFPISQSNLNNCSLCIDRLQCIRLFEIDAEKYLAVQILALHYSVTKKLILVTTQIGK